jgi:hypothetical protein
MYLLSAYAPRNRVAQVFKSSETRKAKKYCLGGAGVRRARGHGGQQKLGAERIGQVADLR